MPAEEDEPQAAGVTSFNTPKAGVRTCPLRPPFAARATVGGVEAANCRQRLGHRHDGEGAWRALDMAKLAIGSFGALAAIASVSFKLIARWRRRPTKEDGSGFAQAPASSVSRTWWSFGRGLMAADPPLTSVYHCIKMEL